MIKINIFKASKLPAAEIVRAVENALTDRAKDIKVDFETTVLTWDHPSNFVIRPSPGMRLIYTNDSIYRFVSGGTQPHVIAARFAPMLVFFRTGFRAKTRTGKIRSYQGKAANRDLTRAKSVIHPGTEAREFEVVIAEKWRKQWPRLLAQAVRAEIIRARKAASAA